MQYNIFMNKRIDTYSVKVGNVLVGSNHPIRVQSMTNTNTSDVQKTVDQILELYDAGSEIVRITVNDKDSAKSVEDIKSKLIQNNCNVPIVGLPLQWTFASFIISWSCCSFGQIPYKSWKYRGEI